MNSTLTIGELVAGDFRKAEVFHKHGIDFCCGGKKTLSVACKEKGVNISEVERELGELNVLSKNEIPDFSSWPLDRLTDYIIEKHHGYVIKSIPVLHQYTQKVAKVHGRSNPEVKEIANLFMQVMNELNHHMMKEENILFPYIKQLAVTKLDGKHAQSSPFGSIQNPVKMMEHEHDNVGEVFKKISALSNNYDPPEWACNSYKFVYAKLKEFESDLHIHIHLENNILFPKAIELENELSLPQQEN